MTPSPAARAEALEPCPWCGNKPTVRFVGDEDGGYHEVACYTPHASNGDLFCGVHADTEELAISAWNSRPALDAQARLIEEAREVLADLSKMAAETTEDDPAYRRAYADIAGWIRSRVTPLLTTLPAKGGAT